MCFGKADDRIELIGTIDELNSYIGHAKYSLRGSSEDESAKFREHIDEDHGSSGRSRNLDYRMSAEDCASEDQIDELEAAFRETRTLFCTEDVSFARLDIARAVTRRAERRFRKVAQNYRSRCKSHAVCEQTCRLSVCRSKICRSSGRIQRKESYRRQ